MSFSVEKNIFRFEVSIDDALTVQMLQRQSDLSNVKTGLEKETEKMAIKKLYIQ